jgi:anti-sigma factor RsiW
MTCTELIAYLTDYVEGNLTADERGLLDQHLALCPDCVAYLKNFEITIRATKCACQHPHPGEAGPIPEPLVQAILAARQRH